MFKGCKKNIIHVKNTGSKYFEQAYFIIKDSFDDDETKFNDMILEANRIVERSVSRKGKSFRYIKGLLPFGFGVTLSAFVYTLILLILR